MSSTTDTIFNRNVSFDINKSNRLLSPGETFYVKLGVSENVSTYFQTIVLSSTREIQEHHIRQSFFKLSATQSLLRAHCRREANGDLSYDIQDCYLEEDSWINIKCVPVKKLEEWINIVSADTMSFDIYNAPLWRLLWLVCPLNLGHDRRFSYVLVFVANHSIVDAKSAADLMSNQFLTLLNNLIESDISTTSIIQEKPIPLAYPSESVFSFDSNYTEDYSYMKTGVPIIWKGLMNVAFWCAEKFKDSKPKMKVFEEINNDVGVCHHTFTINTALTKKLISLCKQEEVTVHTVLLTLLANALQNAETSFNSFKRTTKKLAYTVDYRKFNKCLMQTPSVMGVYVQNNAETVNAVKLDDHEVFFNQMRILLRKIKASNQLKNTAKLTALFTQMLRKYENDLPKLLQLFPQAVTLSNAGNIKIMEEKKRTVNISEQYFSVMFAGGGGGHVFISTLTYREKMFFCIGYDSHWFSNEFAQFIGKDISQSIETLISKN